MTYQPEVIMIALLVGTALLSMIGVLICETVERYYPIPKNKPRHATKGYKLHH